MAEDVRSSASLDTKKFEEGAAKMSAGVKKFAFETEGTLSKLARQLSLTDIAAGAVFATIAKGQQVIRDSITAYENKQRALRDTGKQYDAIIGRIDAYTAQINSNNEAIGRSLSTLDEYRRKLDLLGSESLESVARGLEAAGKRFAGLPPGLQYILASGFAGGTGLLGFAKQLSAIPAPSAGIPNRFGYQPVGAGAVAEYEASKRMAGGGGGTSGGSNYRGSAPFVPPYDPRFRATPNPGASDWMSPGFILGGGYYSAGGKGAGVGYSGEIQTGPYTSMEDFNKYYANIAKATEYANQFSDNLVNNLFDAYSQGKSLMGSIRDSFVGMLKQILADIAKKEISSAIISLIPGAGPAAAVAGSSGYSGASTSPATARMAARAVMPGIRYETRRGRGF